MWVFVKSLSDMMFYLTIVLSMPSVFVCDKPVWPIAAFCALSVAASYFLAQTRVRILRYIPILFPLAFMFYSNRLTMRIMLIPIIVYVTAVIIKGIYLPDYGSFKSTFQVMAIALGIFEVGALIVTEIRFRNDADGFQNMAVFREMKYSVAALFVFLILSIAYLRYQRADHRRGNTGYVWEIVLTFVIGGGLAILTVFVLSTGADLLMRGIELVFAALITLPSMAIDKLVFWMDENVKPAVPEEEYRKYRENEALSENRYVEVMKSVQENAITKEAGFPWIVLVIVFVIAVVAVIVIVMQKLDAGGDFDVMELPGEEENIRIKKRVKSSSNEKVRKLFRKYLNEEVKRGVIFKTNKTSLDYVLNPISRANDEAANELREVYLKARYDENCVIDENELRKANLAMKKMY